MTTKLFLFFAFFAAVFAFVPAESAFAQVQACSPNDCSSQVNNCTCGNTLITAPSLCCVNCSAQKVWRVQDQAACLNDLAGGDPPPSDNTNPIASITAPAANATVAGTVTISANASDNVGVTRVEFLVDGVVKQPVDTSAPYSLAWDTTNGGAHACIGSHTHALVVRAYDAAGNVGTSAVRTVNMNNPSYCTDPGGPPPPEDGPGPGPPSAPPGGDELAEVPEFSAEQMFEILETIGNWIFVAALLIVPIMIIVGATFLLTGGDNPARFSTGRSILVWTVVGLLLVLLSRAVFVVIRNIFGD